MRVKFLECPNLDAEFAGTRQDINVAVGSCEGPHHDPEPATEHAALEISVEEAGGFPLVLGE